MAKIAGLGLLSACNTSPESASSSASNLGSEAPTSPWVKSAKSSLPTPSATQHDKKDSPERLPADLVLRGGKVYSLTWSEPSLDGTPSKDAPWNAKTKTWTPDAQAVAVSGGRIRYVGSNVGVEKFIGDKTRIVELDNATVLPGFIDSHAHTSSDGDRLRHISLVDLTTPEDVAKRLAAAAQLIPKGEWVVGWGFDEGQWSKSLPHNTLLNELIPDHPVHALGLHGFASWNNSRALEKAQISKTTKSPIGGTIVRYKDGRPTGMLLDNATGLFSDIVPKPTPRQIAEGSSLALQSMADLGFVGVHDAGIVREVLNGYETLQREGKLPIRVYAMLDITDADLVREWIAKGPQLNSDSMLTDSMLTVRSVKAYYDASLGAGGARLLEEYSDKPGHRGVSGDGYDPNLARDAMAAGFQLCVHAIGDAGNRETLDFFEKAYQVIPNSKAQRNRIEHAQVIHPDDIPRFAQLNIIASMEPPHAVEDMAWAEERIGVQRAAHAYAWRTLRKHEARLMFNSDVSGSDPSLFYGLHAAITRRNKQRMSPEEAIRGYTVWNAYGASVEDKTGDLSQGKWADFTVMDIDPFQVGTVDPGKLLDGRAIMTVVGGNIVYKHGETDPVAALYTNPLALPNDTRPE